VDPPKTSSLARVDLSVELSEVDEQGVVKKAALRRNPERSFLCGTIRRAVFAFTDKHAGGVRTRTGVRTLRSGPVS
jgi:hypothetical protein